MFAKGGAGKAIEMTGLCIFSDPAVKAGGLLSLKPRGEARELFRIQGAYGLLKLFQFRHSISP